MKTQQQEQIEKPIIEEETLETSLFAEKEITEKRSSLVIKIMLSLENENENFYFKKNKVQKFSKRKSFLIKKREKFKKEIKLFL